MMRIVWQGFVSPVEQKVYVDTLVSYLNGIADPGFARAVAQYLS